MGEPQQTTIEKKKGKRSLPMDATQRQTGKEEPYAYTITDKAFGSFQVLNTANGWWSDQSKVQRLIDAYKIDANDDEACSYAGISIENLRYFKELHPNFSQVKHACHQLQGLKAKQAIANKIETNPEWYLERKRKDEYSTRVETAGVNGRDLFEGLTQQFKELTEKIRNADDDDVQEHTGGDSAGDVDAGQDGARDDASPASDTETPQGPTA